MKRSLFKERLTKEKKKKKFCYPTEHDYNQDISVLVFLPFLSFLNFSIKFKYLAYFQYYFFN